MGSSHEAMRAVKEMNGLWIWGRTLVANIARFGVQSKREHILIRKNNQTGNKESRGSGSRFARDMSYNKPKEIPKNRAQVWKEKKNQKNQRRPGGNGNIPIVTVKEVGNGWHMGGDMVVLTFKDLEERDSMFNKGKMAWLKEWFVESFEWENTKSNPCSRLVWLNCYGIPLHLWNLQTFSEIGKIWGEVIMLADDTMKNLSFTVGKVLISTAVMDSINKVMELENNGRISQIRVMEEQLVVNTVLRTNCACPGCQVEVPSLNQNLDEASVQSPIKMVNGGNARPNLPLIEEVAESANYQLEKVPSLLGPYPTKVEKVSCLININSMQIVPFTGSSGYEHTTRGSRLSDYFPAKGRGAATPYLDALMSNLALPNLSVVTPKVNTPIPPNPDQVNTLIPLIQNFIHHNSEQSPSIVSRKKQVTTNATKDSTPPPCTEILDEKPKRKQRSIEDILGLSKSTKSKKGGRRGKQKCVVYRSATAAAALSVSSKGITNRNSRAESYPSILIQVAASNIGNQGSMKIISLNVRGLGSRKRGVSKEIGEQPEGGHGTTTGNKAKGPSSLPPYSPFGGLSRLILFMLMLMRVLEA
ncbi:hypothetical protein Acr_27g0001440 [Actinidia rufa]|uniref:DUF4283 domain-containing protein n=1 Tax=Actinidia rufa TaxID=165716 RepID=A0A7J0H616_9ERIC|nr:hypothetical protein Acr_27g0001440 [Actinidia rufa]